MNLEEYRQWLRQNGNKEEESAVEVVRQILRYHTDGNYEEVQLYPRHILTREKERIEFDLLIKLVHEKKYLDKLIGVEFKEFDTAKVVRQAARRRDFVDYMYIATRDVAMDYQDVFILCYFGIGWVIWDEGFAKVIVPARYGNPGYKIRKMVDTMVSRLVEERVEKLILTLEHFQR